MKPTIAVRINGRSVEVAPGSTVAIAVFAAGEKSFRRSASGQSRGPLCGMGICFECRVAIDGVPHLRSCMSPCREGMDITAG
jgi:sarcosine oxidase subunit alpha